MKALETLPIVFVSSLLCSATMLCSACGGDADIDAADEVAEASLAQIPPPIPDPVIASRLAPPSVPQGMKVACVAGPNSMSPASCPVLEWGGLTYWAFSYVDDRSSFGVVAFDAEGSIVNSMEIPGARFLWKISLDEDAQSVAFWGQSSKTAVLSWWNLPTMPPRVALPVTEPLGAPITILSVSLAEGDNQLDFVLPGQLITAKVGYEIAQMSRCTGCVAQILMGLAPKSPVGCVYSGVPADGGTAGTGTVTIKAPTAPGLYDIRFRSTRDDACDLTWWTADRPPGQAHNIGVIHVY